MPKFKLEEFLLPWERDEKGNKLDEPKEIDVEQLRKWVYGIMEDRDKAEEKANDAATEVAQAKDALTELQREHENEEQRRAREEKEREQRYAKLEKEALERKKVETIEAAFKDQGITAERAKRLAKRIAADVDEKDWVAEATELVEDGFRISDKKAEEREEPGDDGTDEPNGDDLSIKPRVRRSDGTGG